MSDNDLISKGQAKKGIDMILGALSLGGIILLSAGTPETLAQAELTGKVIEMLEAFKMDVDDLQAVDAVRLV